MTRKSFELVLFAAIMLLSVPGWAADAEAPSVSIPESWTGSPHADATSESFTHWNDEGEIPVDCAGCHSRTGFLDFIGADGSDASVVNKPASVGTLVDCDTCHNDTVKSLSSVSFPSGMVIDDIGSSVQCLICHQGRASTNSVNKAVGTTEDDTVSEELQFINVHYRAAAATVYGTEVKGGYEYPGKTYAGEFAHVPPFNTCSGCHDAHTTAVKVQLCSDCHQGDSLSDIRTTKMDFDGDGDVNQGIMVEIQTLHTALGTAIEQYSREITKKPVIYHTERYPYFFNDSDNSTDLSDEEAAYPNRYQSWTPRLLKAAYNYQFVAKDPGSYAHNPRYVLQLLYDSFDSLAGKLSVENSFKRPE